MALQIHDYMSAGRVLFPATTTRDQTLVELVRASQGSIAGLDVATFEQAVIDREKIVSTGIGLGVAVPHAKLPGIKSFFVTAGILKNPVGWDSIDKEPVRLVFLIGGPDDDQTTYLRILSKIVLVTKNARLRDDLLRTATEGSPENALSLFADL